MSTATALLGPLKAAVDKYRSRAALPTGLRTADLGKLPAAIRDRSFFSAGVEHSRTLQKLRSLIDEALSPVEGRPLMTRQAFIREMRRALGVEGAGDSNDLADLGSFRRLGLIYDMNVAEARAYARWRNWGSANRLLTHPCQELVRIRDSAVPRDWEERWAAEGGEFPDRRMIARKTDPIWRHISRFGRDWPPFDFNSGMGLNEIPRAEAEAIGALKKGERLTPVEDPGFNAGLSASVHDFSPESLHELLASFDGRARIDGDRIVWDAEPESPPSR